MLPRLSIHSPCMFRAQRVSVTQLACLGLQGRLVYWSGSGEQDRQRGQTPELLMVVLILAMGQAIKHGGRTDGIRCHRLARVSRWKMAAVWLDLSFPWRCGEELIR